LIPRGQTNGHTVEESLGWLKWLGVRTVRPPALNYAGNAEAGAWIEGRVGRDPYVVLHPGGVFETKRWSTEGFRTLGAALNAQGWKVVVTAGPGEGTFASEAARDLDPSLLLLGLTIPQLAELIRGADLFVGNDSGPMHLAAAVGTPVVAVWGSSSAERWHPWRVPHRVVQNRLECNPCSGYRCHVAETPQCIESVTPAQVAEAVWSLAAETGLRSPLATGRGGRAR
jgi:ADP-heptose:LPS heptosyltransferase